MRLRRQLTTSLFSLAFASAAVATSGSASPTTFAGPAGKIALASAGAGAGAVLINPDGSGRTVIGVSGGYRPVWSPDGKWLAYSTFPEPWVIRVVRADGTSDREVLSRSAGAPATNPAYAWSPTGSEIAYQCATGLCAVRVADSTTRRILDLTPVPAGSDPAWSPDGSKIAFSCRFGIGLCLVNADGTDAAAFTSEPGFSVRFPDWSPDGSRLLISSRSKVYTLNLDSGEFRSIVDMGGEFLARARWSPDGKSIVISSSPGIYVMRLDGSAPTKIAEGGLGDWGTSPAATVSNARAEPRWVLSRQSGSLELAGIASHSSELQITFRSAKNSYQPIAVSAPAGEYRLSVRLPADLLPGAYNVTVGGASGGERLLDVVRSVQVAAPAAGIVARSWMSATAGGPPRARVPRATRRLFAQFAFAVRPAKGQRLTAVWSTPSGSVRLRQSVPYAGITRAAIADDNGLAAGTWRCRLEAGRTALAIASIRIG